MIAGRFSGITGNVPGVANGFRMFTGRGPTHPGETIGPRGGAPALGGLVGQPNKAYEQGIRKSKRKEKKRRRWEREEGLHLPNQVGLGLGVDLPPLVRPTPLESLDPKARLPPLPPIYSGVLGLI